MAYIASAPVLEPSFSGQLQCSLSRDTVPASTYSDKFLVDSRSLQASSDPLTPGSHAAACCTTNAAASSSSFYPSGWQAMQLNVAENMFQKGSAVAVPSSGGTSANELLVLAPSEISVNNNGSPSSSSQLPVGSTRSSCSGSPELLGSTMMSGDSWQLQLLDSNNAFRSSLNSLSASSSLVLDSNMSGHASGLGTANSLMTGGWRGAGHSLDTMAMSLNTLRTWSSREQESCGLSTLEPTTGPLALQGVGLPTSHCLEQISSDPAFAERAAKYSPFNNGGEYSQPLPFVTSDPGKSRAHVAGCTLRTQPESESKMSRSTSSTRAPAASSAARLNLAVSILQKIETANDPLDTLEAALNQQRGAQDPPVVEELATAAADHEELVIQEPEVACHVVKEQIVAVDGGATDRDNMGLKEGEEAISQEDVSGVIQAAACRESNDEYTGNKRKETHSDASKESNTARYFTETKVDHESCGDQDPRAAKRYKAGCAAADGKGRLLECFPPEDGLVMKSLDKQTERSSSESNSGDSSSPSAGAAAAAAAAAAGNMRMKENVKTLSGSTEPAASKQDYVHVRARRGQATDSHSLAERVRREKISERMKYLQELVPGCSKVTGKAVMLDEIINYVQSLQQQVEFLSMKLAAVNPQLDFNLDSNLKKEILQSGLSSVLGSELTSTFGLHQPLLTSHLAAAGPDFQSPLGTMDSHLCRTISAPTSIPFVPNLDAYGDDDATQMSIGWDREMQGMLHMGFGQTGQATSSSLLEGFNNCQFGAAGHMKVELGK